MSLGALMDGGPFRSEDATRAGVARRRLRDLVAAGRVVRVFRGVYLASFLVDDPLARARAVGLLLPPGAAVCRDSAAWLHGVDTRLPGRHRDRPRLQCLVPADATPPRHAGLEAFSSRLPPQDVCLVGSVPVTTPERTAVDLGRWAPPHVALAALDAFANRGMLDPVTLTARLVTMRGLPHVVRLRRLVDLCEPATESAGESWMRLRIVDAGLPRPQVQIPIMVGGREVYRLDAGYVELRVGFEYDGEEYHRRTADQALADERRRADLLRRFGWVVVGATSENVLGARPAIEAVVGDLIGWGNHLPRRSW